jgi:F0F1-type ATP synthase assembly protein I
MIALLAVGSGTWGLIVVLLLVLCCGGMFFAMRGMGKRTDRTDKTSEKNPDDKPR